MGYMAKVKAAKAKRKAEAKVVAVKVKHNEIVPLVYEKGVSKPVKLGIEGEPLIVKPHRDIPSVASGFERSVEYMVEDNHRVKSRLSRNKLKSRGGY